MRLLAYTFCLTSMIWLDASAATLVWPSTDCPGTLQNCVDVSPTGGIVQVAQDDPIDENIQLYESITLIAAPGHFPTFKAGRDILARIVSGPGVDWSVTIDGFTLPLGHVGVDTSSGNAHITLRNLNVTANSASLYGFHAVITIFNEGSGSTQFLIEKNHVRLLPGVSLAGIEVASIASQSFSGSIHDNRVESAAGTAQNYGLEISSEATNATATIYSNQFSGILQSGMWFSGGTATNLTIVSNAFTTAPNPYSMGMVLTASQGNTLQATVLNNTIAGFATGVYDAPAVSGRLSGNIIDGASGQAVTTQNGATLSEDHNDYFDSVVTGTMDLTSIVANPRFRNGLNDVRLAQGSPAINAADSSALATLLHDNHLPAIDADGLRRFKGATNAADIGAFAFGDGALTANATATNGGIIDDTLLNNNSGALPQVTQNIFPDTYHAAAGDLDEIGMKYSASRFDVFDEGVAFVPTPGSSYNVFVPGAGAGVFSQVTAPATGSNPGNISGINTFLNDASVNSHPERILLVTHQASPIFNHPFGIVYGFGTWFIQQTDAHAGDPDFPSGLKFDVYAQDPSLNAFVWTAPGDGSNATKINHVLLNGEPCGRLYVTRGVADPHPIFVSYQQGRWLIVNSDQQPIPAGAQFHVVVDEAAMDACRFDHIFHDGVDR